LPDNFSLYKLHLILKYLRSRRIAWVSLIAVMLCTTMVLVVISVMGGWLRMFRESFHGLNGDVIVHGRSLAGFPHYQEVIDKIRELPEVEAAVPTLHTYGLVNINNSIRDAVDVLGYPADIGNVNRFTQSLYRQYQKPVDEGRKPATRPSWDLLPDVPYQTIKPNLKGFTPGVIVGAGVIGIRKDAAGKVKRYDTGNDSDSVEYQSWVNLKVLGINPDESVDVEKNKGDRTYWIVDDSRTQVWQYDSKTIYVPFKVLQQDLRMDGSDGEPARASDVQIKIKDGLDLNKARDKIARVVDDVMMAKNVDSRFPYLVETWEESQALWLGAIEHEKMLVTILFGIISIVAIFLIFCIFYMIVVEKTKDIGIIKSVGATGAGVAGIFLGYGLVIGLVGAGMGLLLGYLIVHNINQLHNWLAAILGVPIWNPEVYAFDTIPNTMNPNEVIVICAIAVISSVLGSLIPAIVAALLQPVEALRWE
jgi:lipoprotein-releasing system permease protein